MRTPVWLAATVLTLAAACGGGSDGGNGSTGPTTPGTPPTGPNGSTSTSIAVADNSFTPKATTVPVTSTVTWTWGGTAQHNVTFDDGVASGTQATGTYERTFGAPGTYAYHCTIHGAGMSGTVTVR